MATQEAPYDPYIPNGQQQQQQGGQQQGGNARTQALQAVSCVFYLSAYLATVLFPGLPDSKPSHLPNLTANRYLFERTSM